MDYITLRELTGIVKSAISEHTGEYWVAAEVAHLNVNRKSGHCYLELVEKDGERTVAHMRGTVWAFTFQRLRAEFKRRTGSELLAGMKILMLAEVSFHEVYGLSLNIQDIDPKYTLGEMALRRKETLDRLQREGIIDLNRGLPEPLVPQRIAVISSRTAAGLGDFMHRIECNPYGFAFGVTLFEAYMQGERAEGSIIAALERCRKRAGQFDACVIIRGGGSQADLHCFDSYHVARAVATFPLPVLAGIGHERDETVTDRVSHMRLITPTAVAEHLIHRVRSFDDLIDGLAGVLVDRVEDMILSRRNALTMHGAMLRSAARRHLASKRHGLASRVKDFEHSSVRLLARLHNGIERTETALAHQAGTYISGRKDELRHIETKVRLLDPSNVLRRGYSITRHGGKAVRDASALGAGDIIETRLLRGSLTSTVDQVKDEPDG